MNKRLFRAYRRNTMDSSQREVFIEVLSDSLGLDKETATSVADVFDSVLKENGITTLDQTAFDLYFPVALEVAQTVAAQQEEQEPPEPDWEPAVDYDKPMLYKGRINEAEDAINALSFMVDILHDEGPVKGGGAAQRREKEARSNSRRRVSRRRVSRRSARRNPYRSAAPVRGYRTNPYLPADQDPLSIYRARLNRPGKAPLTSLEHLRAARLLRSHVKGTQNPPDFDSAQIEQIIAILTGAAIDENEAGKYGWKVPKENQRLGMNDYMIVHPESGSVQYEIKGEIEGLLVWKWDGGNHFEVRFPHYSDTDEEGDQTEENREMVKRLRLAPPEEQGVSKRKLLNVYRFADAMQEKGYSVQAEDRPRGQYIGLALRCETSAGLIVAMSFLEAGKALENESMKQFGYRLGVAWRSWASVGDSYVRTGKPSGLSTGTVSASDVEKIASFFSSLSRTTSVPTLAQAVDRAATESMGRSNTTVSDSILGAIAVIDKVRGQVTRVVGLPRETSAHPVKYFYKAKQGDVVVDLPGSCLPFMVTLVGTGRDCAVYIGVQPTTSDAAKTDSLDLNGNKKFYDSEIIGEGRIWRMDTDYAKKPESESIKYKISGQNAKNAANIELNGVTRISVPDMERFAKGLQIIIEKMKNPRRTRRFFGKDFYDLKDFYNNRPKIFYSGEFSAGYLFLPVLVAIYRGILGKTVALRTDTDDFGDTSLTLALSEASPTPFIADGEIVPVGAGRIDPIKVKSLETGQSVTAPGLDPELKKAIKTLLPPPSFQYRFEETVAGKVGEKAKRVRRSFKPYPYQQVGIAFVHAAMGRAMIGDEMGLGKTIQALGALSLDPSPTTGQSMLPALIICPKSVMGSWLKECKRWLPHLSVGTLETKNDKPKKVDITIMSWGIVGAAWKNHEGRYSTVIVDEAHYGKRLLKNTGRKSIPDVQQVYAGTFSEGKDSPFTMRTFGFVRMCQSASHAILLSGTLMENGGKDAKNLWTYLHALDPNRFPSNTSFIKQNFDGDGLLLDVGRFRRDFNQYHIRRMKSTVGEQVNLGCLYSPDYASSDPGCAGSEDEIEVIEIEGGGGGPILPGNELRNPRRNRRRNTRRKSRFGRRMRRNASKGYLRVGKTKKIVKGYIEFTDAQKALYDSIQDGMIKRIKQAKKDKAINKAVKMLTSGGKPDLTNLPKIVAEINWDLAEEDPRKIASVTIAVYHYLRESVGRLKISNAIEWVAHQVFVEKESCIVWVEQRKVANDIAAGLKEAIKGGSRIKFDMILGDTPKDKRTEIVDDFQQGKIDVIIASKAMKEGVTLTRCNRALFVEMWWVGAWMSQAEDRIFRIGQERDCTIEYMLAPNTIDDAIWNGVAAKKATQSMVFGSEEFKQGTEDLVADTAIRVQQMGEKERDEFQKELEDELKRVQKEIDSDDLDADEKAEAEEEKDQLQGQKLIYDVTTQIMGEMMEEARQRAAEAADTTVFITEDDVLKKIQDMGLKEVSYSLTKEGVDWSDEFVLKTDTADEAVAKLSRLKGVSITNARTTALGALEELKKEGIPATTRAIKEEFEQGAKIVSTLKTLTETGNRKIREVVIYKGGVVLNNNQQIVVYSLQEIAQDSTSAKIGLPQIQAVANRNLAAVGRKTKFNLSAVTKALKELVDMGLVTKEEKALDFRQNPRNEARKIRALKNALSKPLPANLQRALRRNAGMREYKRIQDKAGELLIGIPIDPIESSVVRYNELADLMEQIEQNGGEIPEGVEYAADSAHRTLSKLYKG